MRRRHTTRHANHPDGLALADLLSGYNVEPRQMRIVRFVTVAVIHDYQASVATEIVGVSHDAICRSPRRSADGGGNIHARVTGAFARERIGTLSEAAHEHA